MTITYETEIDGKKREISDPDLVDMMKVRGKLRYADRHGSQGKMEAGRILKAEGKNWEVIVKTPSGRQTFNFANFVAVDDGDVYVTGEGMVEKMENSEIMRVRSLMV